MTDFERLSVTVFEAAIMFVVEKNVEKHLCLWIDVTVVHMSE